MTSNLVHILKEHGNDICAFKLFMDENFIVTSYSGTSSLFYSCFNTAFRLIMKKWIKYVNIRSVIQSSFLEGNKWRKFMRGLRLHWVTHAFPMRLWDFGLTIQVRQDKHWRCTMSWDSKISCDAGKHWQIIMADRRVRVS